MKRIYVLFTALCVCCVLAAQDIKELLILHTNDTHSRVEPISITDPNPEFAGKAGFVRRVTLIKEMRKQNKDLYCSIVVTFHKVLLFIICLVVRLK